MERYKQSLKKDKAALSVLQSLSKMGTMDDKHLEEVSDDPARTLIQDKSITVSSFLQRVGQLLSTLYMNRSQLHGVLQQLVHDRLMTNNEAKGLEERCEPMMADGGGKMQVRALQDMLHEKKRVA